MYFIKKGNKTPAMPWFYGRPSSDLSAGHPRERAPCSLVQKTSHSGLIPEDIAVERHENYLYIYLEYAYNVVYIKREYSARYAQFSMCSSQPADPGRMIGTVRRARWYTKWATWAPHIKKKLSDKTEIIYIYISILCLQCNLSKKRIEGRLRPIFHFACPRRQIPIAGLVAPPLQHSSYNMNSRLNCAGNCTIFSGIDNNLCRLSTHIFILLLFAFFGMAYFTNQIYLLYIGAYIKAIN